MNEKPILFSGPMVLAILAGRKTQTRRVITPQPPEWIDRLHNGELSKRFPYPLEDDNGNPCGIGFQDDNHQFWVNPYGQPGKDRLWVRETWKPHCNGPISEEFPLGTCVKYRADGKCIKPTIWSNEQGAWCEANEESTKWRPSIFMPRWASRIDLDLVNVRVERVQDISDADAASEGIQSIHPDWEKNPAGIFAVLWDSINCKRGFGWDKNPWVWVLEFKMV